MLNIKQLISELCPKGVECKPLGELCSIITKQTGFDYSNHIKNSLLSDKKEDTLPYIQTKFFTGKNFIYDTDYFIPLNVADRFPKILLDCKCLLFSIVGASIGNIGLFPGTVKAFCGGAICVAKPLQEYNIEYLYYYLSSSHGQKQIFNKVKGSGQATITIEDIRKFEIPLPPVSIQEEIVRILDEFSEQKDMLISKLNEELNAKKQQYEYFRDLLFDSFTEDTYIPIQTFATCVSGGTPSTDKSEYWENGTISWMSSGEVNLFEVFETEKKITEEGFKNSSTKMIPVGTVVIALAGQGKTRGTVAITRIPLCTNQSLCSIITNDKMVNSEYLLFYLQAQYQTLRKISCKDGMRGGLNLKMIREFNVPVPSISQQKAIVQKIKTFNDLYFKINSEIGLEIKGRQQQYEYFRDKLLTFNCV